MFYKNGVNNENDNFKSNNKIRLYNEVNFCGVIVKKSFVNEEKGTILCKVGKYNGRAKINIYSKDFFKSYGFNVGDVFEGKCELYFRRIKSSNKYSVEFKLNEIKWYKKCDDDTRRLIYDKEEKDTR